ncbi:MAG: M48 family metallopeptidase [Fretibacterium sp.]|nr:M48 family metallopeptidase [Fretibacterium sp.]
MPSEPGQGAKPSSSRVRCVFEEPPSGEKSGHGELMPFTLELGDGGPPLWGTLRRSPRSKRIRLIVDERGLTVTVPPSFRFKNNLTPLLEKHLAWILRSVDRVSLRAKERGRYPVTLPDHITLPALGESWAVELVPPEDCPAGRRLRLSAQGGVIRLSRAATQAEALRSLRTWLRLRARAALPPLLRELAAEFVGPDAVARVFVKELKSRWGSCSSRRNINLNARLLFLPPDLVRHVMLHELCHLAEMNHSSAFYARLNAMDPEAPRHIAELRTAWRLIPAWAAEPL